MSYTVISCYSIQTVTLYNEYGFMVCPEGMLEMTFRLAWAVQYLFDDAHPLHVLAHRLHSLESLTHPAHTHTTRAPAVFLARNTSTVSHTQHRSCKLLKR